LVLATSWCALALGWLGLARTLPLAGLALLALAVGAAGLVLSAGVLLPQAFPPPRYNAVTALNVGLFFLGFGMLLTLRLTGRALEAVSPRRFLLILALLCLMPAFFALQIPHAEEAAAADAVPAEHLLSQ